MINNKTASSLLSFLMMLPTLAFADFSYQKKPITPDCLAGFVYPFGSETTSIKLKSCAKSNAYILADKMVASSKKPFSGGRNGRYTQYKIIGQQNNRYLINLDQWTGGSGVFSYVLWVEKSKDSLQLLKVVATGDRCNGGTARDNEWTFSVNLTSAALLEMTKDKPQLNPYEDLDDSAAGCIGKAYYRFDPATANAKFEFALFDRDKIKSNDWDNKIKYQACFKQLAIYFMDRGQVRLNQAEIDLFGSKFQQKCML